MKLFSGRAWFISLASVVIFLLISFVFYGCDWIGNYEASRDEEKTFFLMSETESLTQSYQDSSIGTVIGVSFNKPIDTGEEQERVPADSSQSLGMLPLEGPALISLFETETQKKIEGTLYLSFDGKSLTFVPASLLTPDTCYSVLISSVARSVDGEYLGDNYLFEVCTNEIGKVIGVVADSYDVMEGDYLSLSAETYITFADMEWNFGEARVVNQGQDNEGAECSFDTPGVYEIKLDAGDVYGRTFTATSEIRVFPDMADALNGQGEFVDVAHVPQGDMPEDTFRELLGDFGDDILATVTADMPLATVTPQGSRVPMEDLPDRLSAVLPVKPLVSVSINPERTASFGSDYVRALIEERRFLGIVSFKGFPAILSYTPLDGYSVLEMLVCEGDIDIRYQDSTYDIDLAMTGMKPTPALNRVSVPITNEVLGNFQTNLPTEIRRPLSVLYTQEDRETGKDFYWLDTYEEEVRYPSDGDTRYSQWGISGSINLGVVEVSGSISSGGVDVDVDVSPELQAVYDFLTGDLVDLLTGVKNFITEVIDQNPFGYLSDVKDRCDDIKGEFVSLYDTFHNASDVISSVTDPEYLVTDMRNFLYANGESSVKAVAGEAINALNQTSGAFQLISEPLLTVADAGEYLTGFIPAVDSDAHVIFHAGTDEFSLKVRVGSVQQTISLDTLNTVSAYADTVLDLLGADFPLTDIIDKLDMLQDVYGAGMAGEVGYYYTGSDQELKLKFSILSGSVELYRLRVMLSPSYTGLDVKVTNPLSTDTWLLLEYEPLPLSITDSTVDLMFDMLAFAASPFPNITMTLQTKYRDIAMQLTSRLRPAYSFSAYVNLGMELDYYIAVGGKGEVGIQLYVGVDGNAIAGDVLKEVATGAFEASRDSFSEHFSTVDGELGMQGMMNFPDEKEFMDFMYSFLGNLRDELVERGVAESLMSSVTVGISPSAEIGIGIGAGGTGTGGGAVNLSVGTAFDVSSNLLFFRDTLLAYYRNNNIDTFLMKPLMESMQAMNASDRSNPFDVKGVARLFEEGFTEIIEQLPAGAETETVKFNAINSIFNSMAENVSVGVSFQAGIDGELEEAANLEAGFAFGPSISTNGEFVFNALYPVLYKAFEIKGASQTMKDRLNVLDQPGIFPEISFAIPLSGCIELGFDEGVQVNLGLGTQMDYIEGTVTLQGDPFRTATGAIPGAKTLSPYPVVAMTQSPSTASQGEAVTFSVSQSELETGTTLADTAWCINGQEITGTGAVTEDSETIATVTDMISAAAITFTPQRKMEYRVRCTVTDSKGRRDFDYIVFTPANGVPEQSMLTLVNDSEISRSALIPVNATDPDGDPLTFEVLIASDAGFDNVLFSYAVSGTNISLPLEIIDGTSYYIKARAFDGVDYGPWSIVSHFTLTSPSVELLLPAQGHSFVVREQTIITLTWNCDAEYARIQVSDDPGFGTTISDVIQDFNFHEITGTVLQGLTPDVYFWRVAGYNGSLDPAAIAAAVFDWSGARAFYMRPQAPILVTPETETAIPYDETVQFVVQVNPDADYYEFEYSPTVDFSSGNAGVVGASSSWQTGPLPIGGYFWHARTWKDGIESSWSDRRSFNVVNEQPSPVYLTSYQKDSCINGVLELTNFWAADPEGNPLTFTVSIMTYDGTGYAVIKSYSGIIPPFSFNLTEGGYDFYVSIEAVDELGTGGKQWTEDEYLHVVTGNCPPPAPTSLSPANGYEVVRNSVTLEIGAVTDVDGDPIDHYEFLISRDGDEEITKYSPIPTILVTDIVRGEYSWKARAVSGLAESGLKTGEYGEERRFSVLDNQAPETLNDSPAAGSVFSTVNWITLAALATDNEEDEISFYEFEYADNDSFTGSVVFTDKSTSSVPIGEQLPAGIYYWRSCASDFGGYGNWSQPTCLSVIAGVEKPTIDDAGNETEFIRGAAGSVNLTFNAQTYTTDCLGRFTGTLEYELRNEENNLIAPIGNFENGVPFSLIIDAGGYFWKARHIVAGLASDWSDPLAITVLEGNQRPVAENITPAGGAMFSDGDEIILTLRAIDPDEDPIATCDFDYDIDPLFSEPVVFSSQESESVNLGTLMPGVYYWRGKASDTGGYGDWSDATCFTVIGSVDPPNIAEAGNCASYRYNDGELEITFHAVVHLLDCLENPVSGVLRYEISYPAGTHSGTFESGIPFVLNLDPGTYVWRAQHEVAGISSVWTEPFEFEVLEANGRPVSENVTPEAGEIFAIENLLVLTLGVSDPDEDTIVAYDFEYDTSINFDGNSNQILGVTTATVTIVPPVLPAETYYWRGRASDAEGYGDWSEPTCFSVIASVDPPDIAGAENDSEFAYDGEGVMLTFHTNPVTLDCTGGFTGTFVYELSDSDVFDGSVTGIFEDGIPFFMELSPGTYYWRARHLIDGIESDPSTVLQFEVSPENQLPTAVNDSPDGEVYPIENLIILTLSASDPNGNEEIQSYDFEYDVSINFDYDPQQIYGVESDSVTIVPPVLSEDTYYWRGRASDAEGPGPWSDRTCFTVIESVNVPITLGVGNASEFQGDGETVDLTFYVNEEALTTNCHYEPVGSLFYEISADPDFEVTAADGNFVSGASFTEWLSPGTYYWRAIHSIAGMESLPSDSLTFTVLGPQAQTLFNEDFDDGIGGWTQVETGAGTFVLDTVADGEGTVFHYRRYNSGSAGGQARIYQAISPVIDITAYSEVYLEFDVKLVSHTLTNSGSWSYSNGGTGEFPADAKIFFTDADESNFIWNHGFLLNADTYSRSNYTNLSGFAGEWYHYTSPNLRTQKTTQTAYHNAPINSNFIRWIYKVELGGEGWDFEGEFDNVKLIYIE